MRLTFAALLLLVLMLLAATLLEPQGDSGAARTALERWRELSGTEVPHPLSSAAHARLGAALESRLATFGLETSHQRTEQGLTNFVARRAGTSNAPPIVLMAHWDSVAAGPGAADDGAGMSVLLELAARAAGQPAAPLRTTIFLATDGEERGLLGAKAFLASHPWARAGGILINMEARGTSGPVFLFETIGNQEQLVRAAREALAYPAAFSLAAEIYARMPNDTDLSVFRADPAWHGYNLAFIRGLQHYHTADDNAANLSEESVAHLYASASQLLEHWQQAPGDVGPGTWQQRAPAAHTSLLGRWLLWWPAAANWPIALALAGFVALWIGRCWRAWLGGWLVLASSGLLAWLLTALEWDSRWSLGAAALLACTLACEARAAVGLLTLLMLASAALFPAALPQLAVPVLAALLGESLRRILGRESSLWWSVPLVIVGWSANCAFVPALEWVQGNPGGVVLGVVWGLVCVPLAAFIYKSNVVQIK